MRRTPDFQFTLPPHQIHSFQSLYAMTWCISLLGLPYRVPQKGWLKPQKLKILMVLEARS